MSELNALYRGVNRSTDVLAFPQGLTNPRFTKKKDSTARRTAPRNDTTNPQLLLGDVVISIPRADRQARLYGLQFYEELLRLLIHGTLHLVGYDHEKSVYKANRMRKRELEILDAIKKMD